MTVVEKWYLSVSLFIYFLPCLFTTRSRVFCLQTKNYGYFDEIGEYSDSAGRSGVEKKTQKRIMERKKDVVRICPHRTKVAVHLRVVGIVPVVCTVLVFDP